MAKYKCPVCEDGFAKLKQGKCPSCDTYLKRVRKRTPEGVFFNEYVIADPKKKPVIKKELTPDEVEEEFELLFLDNHMEVKKHKLDNVYIMTYRYIVMNDWIYCPGCWSKEFKNITIQGQIERKCNKCKALTTYVFI